MGFQCINIRQGPWEVLKTAAFGIGFQHLPRDLANVNAWKTMFDPYIGRPWVPDATYQGSVLKLSSFWSLIIYMAFILFNDAVPLKWINNYLSPKGTMWNLVKIGQSVSEKKFKG